MTNGNQLDVSFLEVQLFPLSFFELRYLGRSVTIDDLHEESCVGRETIRVFIHTFLVFGSTVLYDKHVSTPFTSDDLSECEREYKKAGLPGCIGSTDATHIVIENAPYRLRQYHLGYKMKRTSRTYNLTVDHHRRILSSTRGHPARFNDKFLVKFDKFVCSIKNGIFDDKFHFSLLDENDDGDLVEVEYSGCYLIVDNGYF